MFRWLHRFVACVRCLHSPWAPPGRVPLRGPMTPDVETFINRLNAASDELLECTWPQGRNPDSPWDGDHYRLPGTERPLSVSRTEARFLAHFARLLDCRTILEIGTGFGYSSTWLAWGLSQCTQPNVVYTIDDASEGSLGLHGFQTASRLWAATELSHLVRPVIGRSPDVLAELTDIQADLVFIDGEHRAGQPRMDYQGCRAHLSPTACVVFHDVQEKYDVHEAVAMSSGDGFIPVPLNTSCEPVVAVRDDRQKDIALQALTLALRGTGLG